MVRRRTTQPPAADDAGLRHPARRDRAEPPGRAERPLAAARLPALPAGARRLRRQDGRCARPPAQDLLRSIGRPDRAISETARAKIATRATAMLNDSRLLRAAEALRRGTPPEVIARTEAYANLARPQLDTVRGLMPSDDPLVAVAAIGTARRCRYRPGGPSSGPGPR